MKARQGNCVICGIAVTDANDSREHIVPNSIGGRLKTRGFICSGCNSGTGHKWDAELAQQLNSLCLFFGIVRERGEPPPELIETTASEKFYMQPGGGFVLEKPEYSVTPTETGAQLKIVARDKREARKMLQGTKKKYGSIDVEALLANAEPTRGYPAGMVRLSPTVGGAISGRSIVKTAIAIAHHAGLPIEIADASLAYLRNPTVSPTYGFHYERDLIANRPIGVPLHCAAVSGDPSTGLLLGYVEYFGVHRIVVCLSKTYTEAKINHAYGVDPRTGKALALSVHMPFVAADIQEIYDYNRIPDGSIEKAFAEVIPGAMKKQAESEEQRVVSDAVQHAFANCGAKPGEMLTPEHKTKLVGLLLERMTPYLMQKVKPQIPPSLPPPRPAPKAQNSASGRKKKSKRKKGK